MNTPTVNPLDQLPPLVLPVEPSFWPPAPGWWLLIFLLIVSFLVLTLSLLQRQRKLALKRHCIKALTQFYQQTENNNDSRCTFIDNAATLIRKFCTLQYSSLDLAGLSGKQWINHLNELCAASPLNAETSQLLLDRYQKDCEVNLSDVSGLYLNVLQWFKQAPIDDAHLKCLLTSTKIYSVINMKTNRQP